jgi:hypothetical protein
VSVNEKQTGLRPDKPPYGSVQCHLTKGAEHTTSWLPAKQAVVGRKVELRLGGKSEEWIVTEVFCNSAGSMSCQRKESFVLMD